jgi:hypothetical protein
VAYDASTKEETRGGGIQPDVDMRGKKKGGGDVVEAVGVRLLRGSIGSGRRSRRAHTGEGPGMGCCMWAVLGIQPLGRCGPAQKNSDIFGFFKKNSNRFELT